MMDGVPLALAAAALLCGAAAWLLTPWTRRLVDSRSPLLHRRVTTSLAAVAGIGAVLVARHPAEAVGLCALAIATGLLVPVDLATERLPDAIVLPALGALALALVTTAALTGEWPRLASAVLASPAAGAAFLALAWISPSSLGLGDVKLALPLGLALGWHGWVVLVLGLLAGFLLLLVVALGLLVARRAVRGTQVPFGPLMLLGAAIVLGWASTA